MMILIKKNEYGEVIIIEFIGLKAKMYSIRKINGSESSTAKGVNIVTEINEFKDVLFNKKIIKHKMKTMQAKKHKIGTYEINKYLYHVLMIKYMYYMMEFILELIFVKIVTSCKKDCVN